jgi:hypothetical protein
MDQLVYFQDEMKYGIGPGAVEMSLAIIGARDLPRWVAPPLGKVPEPDCADRQ